MYDIPAPNIPPMIADKIMTVMILFFSIRNQIVLVFYFNYYTSHVLRFTLSADLNVIYTIIHPHELVV